MPADRHYQYIVLLTVLAANFRIIIYTLDQIQQTTTNPTELFQLNVVYLMEVQVVNVVSSNQVHCIVFGDKIQSPMKLMNEC